MVTIGRRQDQIDSTSNSKVEEIATAFQLPLEKVTLLCVEKKISLFNGYS